MLNTAGAFEQVANQATDVSQLTSEAQQSQCSRSSV